MALPEKVIEQLGRESPKTPGWAYGAMLFGGGIFFLAVVIYAGLTFGYQPYLASALSKTQAQVGVLSNSISPSDQTQLISFYSQISNLQSLLQNHVMATQFFTWLENNTEANVYYQQFSFQSQDMVNLSVSAATEADVNQQIAIFENSPEEVVSVSVPSVGAPTLGSKTGWTFNATLTLQPSVFLASTQ